MRDVEKMSSGLLDGVEFADFSDQGGSPNTTMKKTGFPWQPEEVAEILSFLGMKTMKTCLFDDEKNCPLSGGCDEKCSLNMNRALRR